MHPILAFYVYLVPVLHAYGDLCAMIHVLMLIICYKIICFDDLTTYGLLLFRITACISQDIEIEMVKCYFSSMGKCCEPSSRTLSNAGIDRIRSIISASEQRQETLPTDIEACIRSDNTCKYTVSCHRSCVSSYTSKYKIDKLIGKRRALSEPSEPTKRAKRSTSNLDFNFKIHCIFCGEECIEERSSKNPRRWRPVSRCRTIDSGSSDISFKDYILQICRERNDQWAKDVELRVPYMVLSVICMQPMLATTETVNQYFWVQNL